MKKNNSLAQQKPLLFAVGVFVVFTGIFFLFKHQVRITQFAKDSGAKITAPFTTQNKSKKMQFSQLQDRQKVTIELVNETRKKRLEVEVVTTPESTTQGLSGRTEIGAQGMLFVFPDQQLRYFWMKDMLFDIDIVWIAKQKVVGITQNVPRPFADTPLSQLKTYSVSTPTDMVLELPSFAAQKYDIQAGDTIQLVQ